MEQAPLSPASPLSRRSRLAIASLVLSLISVLVIVLMPAPTMNLPKGTMISALRTGKQICTCLTAQMRPDPIDCWPKSGVVQSSTAFFTNIVENGVIKVNYSFFAASEVTPYPETNAALFTAKNNAWCVVADIHDENSDKIPYLFTRNLSISSLAELKGRVGDQLSDELPFGRKGVPVIFKSGFAEILTPDRLWSDVLGGQTFTNRVLRP